MKRIKFLDGIRGISILMVIVAHASASSGFPTQFSKAVQFIFDGSLGVRFFFVLSGFLITRILLEEENKNGNVSIKNFYIKRIFRILPVYLLYVGFIYLIDLFNHNLVIDITSYFQAITFTTGLWGQGSWFLGHTWSLSIEEQFYLLWPLVIIFTKKRKELLWLTFLSFPIIRLFFGYFKILHDYSYTIFLQGDGIVAGCLLAIYYNDQNIKKYLQTKWILIAIVIIYAVKVPLYFHSFVIFTASCNNIIQSALIAYSIATLLSIPNGHIYNILNTTALTFIGKISFSLYIWQQLFIAPAHTDFQFSIFPYNIVFSIIVATASYYLVEIPFLRMRNKYVYSE